MVPLVRIHEMSPSGELGRQVGIGTLVFPRIVLVHPPLAETLADGETRQLCIVGGPGWLKRRGPQQIPVLYVLVGDEEAGARDGAPALVALQLAAPVRRLRPVLTRPFISTRQWVAEARRHLENPQGHAKFGIEASRLHLPDPLLALILGLFWVILELIAIVVDPMSNVPCKYLHIFCPKTGSDAGAPSTTTQFG